MKDTRNRSMVLLLAALAVATVAIFGASALRDWRGGAEAGAATAAGWAVWVVGLGAVIVATRAMGARGNWAVGTREVVYMAVGAALYGVLSWPTNVVPISIGSLVSLRPAVAVPLFFGWAFGPVVGFFAGAMGNILGDFLTGWGVFPAWDLANGLLGLITGLCRPSFPIFPESDGSAKAMLPRREIPTALVASGLAVVLAMAFGAASSILINGYTPLQAFTIEFLPAVTANLAMALIFVPMLLRAWQSIQTRRGR